MTKSQAYAWFGLFHRVFWMSELDYEEKQQRLEFQKPKLLIGLNRGLDISMKIGEKYFAFMIFCQAEYELGSRINISKNSSLSILTKFRVDSRKT